MNTVLFSPRYTLGLNDNFTIGSGLRQFQGQFEDASQRTLAVGTAAGQVNADPSVTVTIPAPASGMTAAPVVLDLTNLTDDSGRVFVLTGIEAIKVTNRSTTAGQDVVVGGGTNGVCQALTDWPLVATTRGDATLAFATPKTIDATHKLLQIAAPNGATVVVSMFGRSSV